MIKASELRIGNYVNLNPELLDCEFDYFITAITHFTADVIILGADLFRVNATPYRLSDLILIPLTEEWLLNFGFKKQSQDAAYWYPDSHLWIWLVKGQMNAHSQQDKLTHVQYVHQLQNLFFALTGEELTVKEHSV